MKIEKLYNSKLDSFFSCVKFKNDFAFIYEKKLKNYIVSFHGHIYISFLYRLQNFDRRMPPQRLHVPQKRQARTTEV